MVRRVVVASLLVAASIGSALFVACTPESETGDGRFRGDITQRPEHWVPAPLPEAYCEIVVEGEGTKDIELDYLPHVITCENGGANLEALKAQAIAARSVAYYSIETNGSICDGQGCQVYGCGANPGPMAYQAVEETAGMYLSFNNVLTYAFYVAGDSNVSPPACVGDVNVGTEHWVTYNEGQTGSNVEQTALGWVFAPNEPGYGQNRGCMSQWGARCLENSNGYDYVDILKFYYGADINIVQAQGACVPEPPPGDGDGDGDGSPGDGDGSPGDGDGDPTTTSGDGDGDPDPTGGCSIGGLGCMCTMGGGCDPGLMCVNGWCVPEDPPETGDDGTTGATAGLTNGWQDDAFDGGGEGCTCSTETRTDTGLAGLATLALLGLLRRRRRG